MLRRPVTSLFAIGTLALISACGSAAAEPVETTDMGSELAAIAVRDGVPGFAYAVVGPDGIVEAGGVGMADVDADVPATADTLFHIGSTHKAMNALLVATLVDDGTIEWDSALAGTVDEFDIDPEITMTHLLTMTSGLPATAEDDLAEDVADQAAIDDAVFEAFESAEPLGAPGSVFDYSNVSASAAGYFAVVAEDPDASNVHQGYLDLFDERVLGPLGMTDSLLLASEARASGQLARSYEVDSGDPVVLSSKDVDLDTTAPSGSLKSSANDMAKFLQLFVNEGRTPNGAVIVSPASIATMWTPALEGYAMGWEAAETGGVGYLSHEGSFDGFLSLIMVIPDRDAALVLLTNSEQAAADLVASAPALFVESS